MSDAWQSNGNSDKVEITDFHEDGSVDVLVTRAEVPAINVPVVIHEGRYRLYRKPDGGLRLQYKRDDKDTEDFFELPAQLVKLLDRMQEGEGMTPAEFLREGFKIMRGGR
jgi:hypothetical protein